MINSFQKPVTDKNRATNPRVMLISLKSGAVGLNLTMASNVFLVGYVPALKVVLTVHSVTPGGSLLSRRRSVDLKGPLGDADSGRPLIEFIG